MFFIQTKHVYLEFTTCLLDRDTTGFIRVVFVSPQSSTKSAEVIAGEIGGEIMFIDPLARSYIPNMRTVIEQLTQAMR